MTFCKGSATDLMDIIGTHPLIEKSTGPTVVTCVNNTLGVFPDAIKPRTYSQVCFCVWCGRPLFLVYVDRAKRLIKRKCFSVCRLGVC